jgi:outer membrane protein OmpA-like peptidoglycan-associated protein
LINFFSKSVSACIFAIINKKLFMKKLLFSLIVIGLAVSASAQTTPISYKKRPSIGFHFQLQDVTTPGLIGAGSLSSVFTNNQWTKIKDLDPGMSFQYIEGLNEYVDLQVSIGAASVRYPFRSRSGVAVPTAKRLLLETDVAINVKMLKDKYFVVPYFTIGAGASMYGGTYFATYAPIGLGMQFKLGNDNFLTTNFVHRTAMSTLASNHFTYNIGIVSPIKDRPEPVKVTPPPPPPPAPEKDSDNDGLVDSKDKCPTVAGVAKYDGCPVPDTDNDGVNDENDKCPTVKGLAKYQGCPIPDTDKDGVNDEEDKCPTVAGVARYQGCPVPDTDNDGVNDEEDKCPTLAGVKENNGCPAIKQEVAKTVTDGAKKITFVTGSAKLASSSFKGLNKVAKALNEDANLKLTVEGHCDNTGTDAINDPLSENRAKSVQTYLTTKGKVDAAKIMVAGFGSKNPIADNKTVKGRAANRRVELKLNY